MLVRRGISALGWSGVAFVLYGLVSAWTGQPWPPLERFANAVSSGLTIAGCIVTAVSIYFFSPTQTQPDVESIAFFAPAVIISGLVALGVLFSKGNLPVTVVNGFAILAIAGGLFRIQRNPTPAN